MIDPKALLFGAAFAAWIYSIYRNDERRLKRDFAAAHPFAGPLEPCLIRFPLGEAQTDCLVGADGAGLYLTSSEEALARSRWSFQYRHYDVLRTPLFIPWEQLEYAQAKFPLKQNVRFTVPANQATFFMPRAAAERLLQRAGRPPVRFQ